MTFYLFFLIYLGAGILICGALFYWAVSNGQFKDQDRARYFPLAGEAPQPKEGAATQGRILREMAPVHDDLRGRDPERVDRPDRDRPGAVPERVGVKACFTSICTEH